MVTVMWQAPMLAMCTHSHGKCSQKLPIWELTVSYVAEEQCNLERLCDLPRPPCKWGQGWVLNPGIDLLISPKAQVDLTGSLKLTMVIYTNWRWANTAD